MAVYKALKKEVKSFMKQTMKLSIYTALLGIFCLLSIPANAILRGRTFFYNRSQSTHAERELVGWQEYINLFADENYGAFYVMPLFSRSMRHHEIAEYLFGNDELVVSGSRTGMRPNDELLADYFGLPLDFESELCFSPRVYNVLLDLNLYLGLDCWHQGLYFRIHGPFVHTAWNLRMHEKVINCGKQGYPAGYMASSSIPRSLLMVDASEYFRGVKQVGDIQPLSFGKINCERTHNGLSDVELAFGWNFVIDPEYHFGMNVRAAIPTGNRSNARYLFEPIVGNGGHWELGFGFTGHTLLRESEDGEHVFMLYGDMNVMHLFRTCQKRSFDLKKNGALSRYILIEEIGTPVVQGLMLNDVAATSQYHGKLMPAINKTTLTTDLSITAEIDLALKLSYRYCGYALDIGYDLWARTSEKFHGRECFPANSYAVKGDAQIYGFTEGGTPQFVALNVTQHEATIHAGQGTGNANKDFTNANADNSTDAAGDPVFAEFNGTELTQMFGTPTAVQGSEESIFLQDCDLDNLSAVSPTAITNSFFGHVSYSWIYQEDFIPFLGAGAEWTGDAGSAKRHSALSEWAVWVKGGIAY